MCLKIFESKYTFDYVIKIGLSKILLKKVAVSKNTVNVKNRLIQY